MVFPAGDGPARVVEPGEEPFDFPAAAIASEGPPILRRPSARAVGRDHLDAVLVAELGVEPVAVIAAVADQSSREFGEEPRVEGGGDEVRLIR